VAYEEGTASSQQNLIEKLFTFAQANGWTQDELDVPNKRAALHKDSVFIQLRWDAVNSIALYQSLGWDGSAPGHNPDDSGNGQVSANPLTTERRINAIGSGPFTAYAFFADASYIHVALEYAAGLYRHMSWGIIEKTGDWDGGEYAAGHFWDMSATGLDYNAHACLVDWANQNDAQIAATIHVEGLPADFQGSAKWGVVIDSLSTGTDRASVSRLPLLGGWREGFLQNALGWIEANPNNGFVPLLPAQIWRTRRAVTPQQWMYLGELPDIRFVNMQFLNPGDEFVYGGDTWKCFPFVKKSSTTNAGESGNLGVAYRRID
jgi:hypothetical protein